MKKSIVIAVALMILLFPAVALADFGPKSSLEIYLDNMPAPTWYMDLLVQDTEYMDEEYNSKGYNDALYRLLWEYDEDGYRAVLVHQNDPGWGVRGKLTGGNPREFAQAPGVFKIIIVSRDGVRVSEAYRRTRFSEKIRLDCATMQITSENVSPALDWLLQLAKTLPATLLIEGIILLMFGFKLKPNWKPFLIVNSITQILLIVSMGFVMLYGGALAFMFLFMFAEAGIIGAESFAYKKLLRREEPGGRVAYAVTANIVSLLATFAIVINYSPMS